MAERHLAVGGSFAGHRLVRLVGQGAMGEIWEAEGRGARVAIKVLPRAIADDATIRARFEREGAIAASMRHPNVVTVHEVGTADGVPYLVMELLDGEDLGYLLDRMRPLPQPQIAELLVPICAAVAAVHREGVVHRDLKPENVFLAYAGGGMVPKLLDFGLAKIVEAMTGNDLTRTAAMLGTPYYMPPEQIRGAKHVDARSDVYALGVILYECATGRRPFEHENLMQLVLAIARDPVVPVRQWNPAIDPAFEAVIAKAMARDPAERHATAEELGRALEPFAGG